MFRFRPRTLLVGVIVASVSSACGSPDAGEPGTSLRVMTYNIHYGDPELSRMASVICSSGADVVGLQEVDVHWGERSSFADQAAEIARSCGMDFRFGPIYTLPPRQEGEPDRQFGVAVLTRRSILGWENHAITRLSTQAEAGPTPMPGFLEVTVEVDGIAVRVFVTHLDFRPDPAVREAQVREMLAIMRPLDRPTVLLGDMNATPDRAELAPLFVELRDAWYEQDGPGFTFPGDVPVRRIDYVMVGGGFEIASATVPDSDASDHRPVVADLLLRPR